MNSGGAASSSPVLSRGSSRRSSASGCRITVVSLRASTTSSQIADRPLAHRPGEGPVLPHRFLALDEEAAEQIGGRQVVVAGHGVQRPAQPCRHVAHEAALAASSGTLQQGGKPVPPGGQEHVLLVTLRQIEGRFVVFAPANVHAMALVQPEAASPDPRVPSGSESPRTILRHSARDFTEKGQMLYDVAGCWRYPMLMVVRLIYRVLLQSLDRGASAEPKDAGAAGRPSSEIRGTRRRRVATPAVLLGAGAIAALVLAGLLPVPLETTGDRAATLRLSIPEVDAKPLVVYLRGTNLDSAAPAAEASPLPRIRSVRRPILAPVPGRHRDQYPRDGQRRLRRPQTPTCSVAARRCSTSRCRCRG